MAISYIGATTASIAGTSTSVTAPAGTVGGDTQLLFVSLHSTSETITPPTGCTLRRTVNNDSDPTTFSLHVFTTTSVTGSITVNKSGSTGMVLSRLTYRDAAFESDVGSSNTSASSTVTLATATTTVANSALVACAFESSTAAAATFTPPSGWTERIDTAPQLATVFCSVSVADAVAGTAGNYGGSFAASRGDYWTTITVVLAPAAPPVGNAGAFLPFFGE